MASTLGRLTALKVKRLTKSGLYADGGGLYVQVTGGGRSWIFRYKRDGRARDMGLGSLKALSIIDARAIAMRCRRQRQDGIDPIEARDAQRRAAAVEAAKAKTFRACAESYIEANRPGWHNPKHAAQWETTLEAYVYPMIGHLPVQAIDTGLIMDILRPLWSKKTETASRVRGRVEAILNYATASEWRSGPNPALWRGHLSEMLPKRSRVRSVKHHAALPYGELPGFMATLRGEEGISARALEFAILTAARTGEAIGVTWGEIDFGVKLWTIPAERMKAGREHRVPLSARAVEILDALKPDGKVDASAFVFGGAREGRPLSNMALLMLLRRMGRVDLTAHGFRSTFRDWAAERTNSPSEVAEMALAHTVGDKVEAAYRRGDLFEKRRRLASDWARYCGEPQLAADGGKVVSIREPRAG